MCISVNVYKEVAFVSLTLAGRRDNWGRYLGGNIEENLQTEGGEGETNTVVTGCVQAGGVACWESHLTWRRGGRGRLTYLSMPSVL